MGVYTSLRRHIPWNLRFRLNHLLLDSPLIGLAYMRLRRTAFKGARIEPHTGLFIDGFPRSANTFAYLLLKDLYEPEILISGHGHSAAALIEAASSPVPTVLLIRPPQECVPSLVQLAEGVHLATAFKAYARFHEALRPYADQIYIARFDRVTRNPELFVDELQSRFALPSAGFSFDGEKRRHIDNLVISSNALRHGGKVNEKGLALPTSSRISANEVLDSSTENYFESMSRAEAIYQELVSAAGV